MFITQVFDNLLDNQLFYIDIDNMLGGYLIWFKMNFDSSFLFKN